MLSIHIHVICMLYSDMMSDIKICYDAALRSFFIRSWIVDLRKKIRSEPNNRVETESLRTVLLGLLTTWD
jgi:hypothetical protein